MLISNFNQFSLEKIQGTFFSFPLSFFFFDLFYGLAYGLPYNNVCALVGRMHILQLIVSIRPTCFTVYCSSFSVLNLSQPVSLSTGQSGMLKFTIRYWSLWLPLGPTINIGFLNTWCAVLGVYICTTVISSC